MAIKKYIGSGEDAFVAEGGVVPSEENQKEGNPFVEVYQHPEEEACCSETTE